MEIGKNINSHNDTRRDLDKKATSEAVNEILSNDDYRDRKSIVLYNPTWNKGIIGIVASRIVEEGNARIVGEKHIKMRVCYRNKYCRPIDAIAFNQKENFDKVTSGEDFDMLYHVEENTWNNVTSIQLNVKDIKCSD